MGTLTIDGWVSSIFTYRLFFQRYKDRPLKKSNVPQFLCGIFVVAHEEGVSLCNVTRSDRCQSHTYSLNSPERLFFLFFPSTLCLSLHFFPPLHSSHKNGWIPKVEEMSIKWTWWWGGYLGDGGYGYASTQWAPRQTLFIHLSSDDRPVDKWKNPHCVDLKS